jgi:hypothetical protein
MALTARRLEIFTFVLTPDHGGISWGMQAAGVRTPYAAVVAARTAGFNCDVHDTKVAKRLPAGPPGGRSDPPLPRPRGR